MALVVATLLLNWIMICLAHLRFRAAMRRKGRETQFKALVLSRRKLFVHCVSGADSGVNVYDGRYAIVGDFAAGMDCIPVYRVYRFAP